MSSRGAVDNAELTTDRGELSDGARGVLTFRSLRREERTSARSGSGDEIAEAVRMAAAGRRGKGRHLRSERVGDL